MERVDRGVPEGRGQEGWEGRSRAPGLYGCFLLRLSRLSQGRGPVWSTAAPWHLEASFQKAQEG